jgi:hypothetical protein
VECDIHMGFAQNVVWTTNVSHITKEIFIFTLHGAVDISRLAGQFCSTYYKRAVKSVHLPTAPLWQ